MIELSVDDMVRSYLIGILNNEFQYSNSGRKAVFNCKDPKIYDLLVSWLNLESKGVVMFSSSQFRMVVIVGACPRTFFLKLLHPNRIEATMM